jgi:hypothetical protein
MRKLAPVVLMSSMLAFAGSAFANSADKVKTDNVTGSPTVSANKTNGADLSYSDKSNTSPGTNAKLDKPNKKKMKAKADAKADVTMDTTVSTPEASTSSAPMASPAPTTATAPADAASAGAKSNETTGLSPQ